MPLTVHTVLVAGRDARGRPRAMEKARIVVANEPRAYR